MKEKIMQEINVSITGAAGQIGYAMLFRLASGEIFGKDIRVHLKLLELPQALGALEGVKMELDDCAFPQLGSITVTDDLNVAFKDSDWVLLVGSVPRKAGMERKDLLNINGKIFIAQGKAIDESAKVTCKVLVVGNPCNTNALITLHQFKRISTRNIFAMTMLDEKRAISQIAEKVGVHNTTVKKMTIWGNHSSTQYPDFYHTEVEGIKVTDKISDEAWLRGEFITTVQQRGAAIINARGASSAASAASAALATVKALTFPTTEGEHFSVAVFTKEANFAYGIKDEIMFSYPIVFDGKDWRVVEGIEHNDFGKEKIELTRKELVEEKEVVKGLF